MQILLYFVIAIHVIVCLFLIGVVLLQQGRSADLAGAFAVRVRRQPSAPVPRANIFTRLTSWAAIIFMLTSLSLTILYVRTQHPHSVLDGTQTTVPAKTK